MSVESRELGYPLQMQVDTNILVSIYSGTYPLASYLIQLIRDVGGIVFYSPQARREFLNLELGELEQQRRENFLQKAKGQGILPLEQDLEQSKEFQFGVSILSPAFLGSGVSLLSELSKRFIEGRLGDGFIGGGAVAEDDCLLTSVKG